MNCDFNKYFKASSRFVSEVGCGIRLGEQACPPLLCACVLCTYVNVCISLQIMKLKGVDSERQLLGLSENYLKLHKIIQSKSKLMKDEFQLCDTQIDTEKN